MTHVDQARTAASDRTAHASKRRQRRRRPGPFPVTIVRPATLTVDPLTPDQRGRQSAANQMAHRITEASREATRPDLGVDFPLSLRYPPIRDTVRDIVRDAPGLAANPPVGAVRIGRNNRGRIVVIVLHAAAWSLLLCPAQPHPAVWVFLGQFGHDALRFYRDGDLLSVRWTAMAAAVFTALNT